ncbi:unnamed protein product [Vitrella brassicaformis CCMP3155]|uniref:Uncharacterized protein n=3 Tax=Vitrella brassicaformis TaxID=1169539 RepID=A0A0G4GY32_VITBC|nr:unnamed protein product [Vitrella brassicaformis CCMP3155]|eukprot:CEM35933.1 unnamed protein product [Vitrella brassicaformis CCMP3155]
MTSGQLSDSRDLIKLPTFDTHGIASSATVAPTKGLYSSLQSLPLFGEAKPIRPFSRLSPAASAELKTPFAPLLTPWSSKSAHELHDSDRPLFSTVPPADTGSLIGYGAPAFAGSRLRPRDSSDDMAAAKPALNSEQSAESDRPFYRKTMSFFESATATPERPKDAQHGVDRSVSWHLLGSPPTRLCEPPPTAITARLPFPPQIGSEETLIRPATLPDLSLPVDPFMTRTARPVFTMPSLDGLPEVSRGSDPSRSAAADRKNQDSGEVMPVPMAGADVGLSRFAMDLGRVDGEGSPFAAEVGEKDEDFSVERLLASLNLDEDILHGITSGSDKDAGRTAGEKDIEEIMTPSRQPPRDTDTSLAEINVSPNHPSPLADVSPPAIAFDGGEVPVTTFDQPFLEPLPVDPIHDRQGGPPDSPRPPDDSQEPSKPPPKHQSPSPSPSDDRRSNVSPSRKRWVAITEIGPDDAGVPHTHHTPSCQLNRFHERHHEETVHKGLSQDQQQHRWWREGGFVADPLKAYVEGKGAMPSLALSPAADDATAKTETQDDTQQPRPDETQNEPSVALVECPSAEFGIETKEESHHPGAKSIEKPVTPAPATSTPPKRLAISKHSECSTAAGSHLTPHRSSGFSGKSTPFMTSRVATHTRESRLVSVGFRHPDPPSPWRYTPLIDQVVKKLEAVSLVTTPTKDMGANGGGAGRFVGAPVPLHVASKEKDAGSLSHGAIPKYLMQSDRSLQPLASTFMRALRERWLGEQEIESLLRTLPQSLQTSFRMEQCDKHIRSHLNGHGAADESGCYPIIGRPMPWEGRLPRHLRPSMTPMRYRSPSLERSSSVRETRPRKSSGQPSQHECRVFGAKYGMPCLWMADAERHPYQPHQHHDDARWMDGQQVEVRVHRWPSTSATPQVDVQTIKRSFDERRKRFSAGGQ